MSWPLGNLKDIAEVISGYAFKSTWFDEGVDKVIRIGDLQEGKVNIQKAKTFDSSVHTVREQFRIRSGDILMALSGATVGKIAVADRTCAGAYLNQRVAIIRAKQPESANYIKYIFSGNYLDTLLLNAGGAAQPNLSPKDLLNMQIPLPPLDEQKRIAAILDKADVIRQKRKQAIDLADEFLRSVFLDMFGDPVTNPKGWEERKLITGLSKVQSGWSAKGESFPCASNELGVLKVSAVSSGYFKEHENKFVSREIVPEGKSLLFPKKGDLLFSRANTRELVAATCIVTRDYDNVFLPDKLWKVEPNEDLIPEFLHMLIQQPRFKERLTSQATGSSGSMLNISKSKFEQTMSIFPSIEEQIKFKDIYWKVMKSLDSLETSETKVGDFFNSLSQKAFSGQL